MNGWAKYAGILTIVAGLVYLIAIALALADGASLGDDGLADFVLIDNYEYCSVVAGLILAIAGLYAIMAGIKSKRISASMLGTFYIVTGTVFAVTAFKDTTSISSDALLGDFIVCFVLIAVAALLLGIQKRRYEISIISIILAYCVVALYLLDTSEGMAAVIVGAILLTLSGAIAFIPDKVAALAPAESVEPSESAEEVKEPVRSPVSAPVPAKASTYKPEPKPESKPEPVAKPVSRPAPAPAAAHAAAATKPAPAKPEPAPVKEEPKPEPAPVKVEPKPEPAPVKVEPKPEPAPVKVEPKPEPAPVKVEPKPEPASVKEEPKPIPKVLIKEEPKPEPVKEETKPVEPEKSELDILLEQGWNVTVAKVGEDKAEDLSDEEIMAVIKGEDEELYNKISALTGLVAAEPVKEEPAEEVKEEVPAEPEPVKEEVPAEPASKEEELDKLVDEGWDLIVAKVGEDKANEMTEQEIMALIKSEDEDLYRRIIELSGASEEEAEAPSEPSEPVEEVKEEVPAEPEPVKEEVPAEPEPVKEEKSEEDILLEQGWNVTVAKVGEDKAEDLSDEEIMAVIKGEDEELYNKISALTGLVAAEPVKEEPAEEVKEEVPAEPEPVKEEKSEEDILLEQGWNVTVAKVGEDKAEDLSDEEIMAVIKGEDEELYNKISALTGLVAAEPVKEEPAEEVKEEVPAEPEPVKEEKSEEDILLEQGWTIAVKKVGKEKANELSDEELLAIIKDEDEELYNKISAATGIVAAEPEPVEEEVSVEPEPVKEEKSEKDILLEQGWTIAVKKVGKEKANELSDEELLAIIKDEDEELYNKISAATGIVAAEPEPVKEEVPAEPVKEEVPAEPVKEEVPAEPEPVKEETELQKLLAQGWEVTVANVGEERANEMSDYEIMAVISVVDPALYSKLSILTGIIVSTGDEEDSVEIVEEPEAPAEVQEESGEDLEELGMEPDTPAGFLRRACWNKGLRCRKDYGPYYIPVAFVKSKVAVYIDGDVPDNRNDEELRSKSWIVLHFKEADITDGAAEAQVVYDAVKENNRALKKKTKSKSKSASKSKSKKKQ